MSIRVGRGQGHVNGGTQADPSATTNGARAARTAETRDAQRGHATTDQRDLATNPVGTPARGAPRVWLDLGSLGQRVVNAFQAVARPALPVVLGALMAVGGAQVAQAQERSAVASPTTVSQTVAASDRFEPSRFMQYPLFKMFWNQPSTAEGGLTNQGEFELSSAGVAKLKAFAESHDLDGRSTNAGAITEGERELVRYLLSHPHYGAFVEQHARPELQRAFGLPVDEVRPTVGVAPVKVGDIDLPQNVSRHSAVELRGPLVQNLGNMFTAEYGDRRAYFEDPSVSTAERSRRVLGLFADYAGAVAYHGNVDFAEQGMQRLMDAVKQTPHWAELGAKDFNGAGWNVLESIALGLDANAFKTRFPDATTNVPVTYFSMNGNMAAPMSHVDRYRVALGQPTAAAAFEAKSVLGFIVGDESGHMKHAPLDERRPFATSGVNWGRLLFPNDAEIGRLAPKPGFEFPIDAIDAFGVAFNNNPAWGDRIVVTDAQGAELRVQREIQNGADGQPATWTARFFRGDVEVPPDQVLGVIRNASGRTKGDGRAASTLDMSYWGYCNVNTAQGVYKPSYGIPQLTRSVVPVEVNGQIITFPTEAAQRILDADIESLIPRNAYAGFRFSGEPQDIRLKDGTTLRGVVLDYEHLPAMNTTRDGADRITVTATPESPFRGLITLTDGHGNAQRIDARNIVSITEGQDGAATIEYRYSSTNDWTNRTTGKLNATVDFTDLPQNAEGKRVWTPQTGRPIAGEMQIRLGDGTVRTVPASSVERISGETQSDVRPSQFVAMVSQMNGVYATDASRGLSVSNGARYVNGIETIVEQGSHRPDWAKGPLNGIYGPLVRQEGDRMMYRRGEGGGYASFAMWHQLDKSGSIVNEGWLAGEPDFLWGATAPLDWSARSVWNPHMPPDLRLKLFVNGVDEATLEARAKQLNLPANWRELRVPDSRIPATPAGTDGNAVASPR
jgi:hypothetical protein